MCLACASLWVNAKVNVMTISVERLKAILRYDPITGIFSWVLTPKGKTSDSPVGTYCRGYVRIGIDGSLYAAHRLAWLYMTGEFPVGELDHTNRNRSDNRWSNIRPATRSQNCANKKHTVGMSGSRGVWLVKKTGRWAATVCKDGKRMRIGTYETVEQAEAAYKNAAEQAFGKYFCP